MSYTEYMSTKSLVMLGMTVGSAIGSFIPTLWGASFLSYTSLILSAVGGLLGIWIAMKVLAD